MRLRIIKPRGLRVICSADILINLNEYLDVLPREKVTDKCFMKKLNEILLNSIPNSWSQQAYVQVFDFEYTTLNKSVNMFERMEIAEYIYRGVV